MTILFVGLMCANTVWFGLAFRYFFQKPFGAAAALVPKAQRDPVSFRTLAMSIRFLGGMNGAFALLSMGLALSALLARPVMSDRYTVGFVALVLSSAHFSQWWGNLAPYRQEGRGEAAPWRIRGVVMWWIFVIDGTLALANLVLGVRFLV